MRFIERELKNKIIELNTKRRLVRPFYAQTKET